MMWDNASDFDCLVEAVYGYFSEYGTYPQEQACMRELEKIQPKPENVDTLQEWYQHILMNQVHNKRA